MFLSYDLFRSYVMNVRCVVCSIVVVCLLSCVENRKGFFILDRGSLLCILK